MKYDQFVAEVRNLAELGTNEEAESAIRATFTTLRERLAGDEPANLAAQIPPQLARPLNGSGGREDFPLDEFYDRVAQKEGIDTDEAVRHARAVAAVLQTAVTGGEIGDIRDQLTDEYADLFGQPGA